MPRVKPIYSSTFSNRRKILMMGLVGGAIVALAGIALFIFLQNPRPSANRYPELGVRVDQTDGTQDFNALHAAGVDFAYIKATEGASYFDDDFDTNYTRGASSPVALGVYHYFSFSSSAAAQVAAFTKHVGQNIGTLPIGIEIEDYTTLPIAHKLVAALNVFAQQMQLIYGRKCLLIGNTKMLDYVQSAAPTALRMVINHDSAAIETHEFWQYSTSAKIPGGSNHDYQCIVYTGSQNDWQKLLGQ